MFHIIAHTTRLLCLVSICLNPMMAHGTMYKWVDETGVTQYTQTPPTGIKADKIGPASKPANDPETLKKEQSEKMEGFEKRRQAAKKQQELANKEKQDKAKLKERCAKIQKNMDTLKYRNRVTEKQNGEVVVLGTEVRDERLKKFQEQYNKDCK